MDHINLLKEAQTTMKEMMSEFRALDLPYGSRAYTAANDVVHKIEKSLVDIDNQLLIVLLIVKRYNWLMDAAPEDWDNISMSPDREEELTRLINLGSII